MEQRVVHRLPDGVAGKQRRRVFLSDRLDEVEAETDGDALDLTMANPVGSPKDLGGTLIIEHVVT